MVSFGEKINPYQKVLIQYQTSTSLQSDLDLHCTRSVRDTKERQCKSFTIQSQVLPNLQKNLRGITLTFPKWQILDCSKLKELADDNFKFDENGRKFSKRVENTVGKGEIARYEQFLLFPQCFQKTCNADTWKPGLFGKGLRKQGHWKRCGRPSHGWTKFSAESKKMSFWALFFSIF